MANMDWRICDPMNAVPLEVRALIESATVQPEKYYGDLLALRMVVIYTTGTLHGMAKMREQYKDMFKEKKL